MIKKGWEGKLIDIDEDECLTLNRLLSFFYPKSKTEIINTVDILGRETKTNGFYIEIYNDGTVKKKLKLD